MTLAQEVLQYRAKNNLTQKQFADLCEVGLSTIWRLENGSPTLPITEAKIRLKIGEQQE